MEEGALSVQGRVSKVCSMKPGHEKRSCALLFNILTCSRSFMNEQH
jgi:hypothetical protein